MERERIQKACHENLTIVLKYLNSKPNSKFDRLIKNENMLAFLKRQRWGTANG